MDARFIDSVISKRMSLVDDTEIYGILTNR